MQSIETENHRRNKDFRKSLSFRFRSSLGKKASTEELGNFLYKNENINSQPPFDVITVYEEKTTTKKIKKHTHRKEKNINNENI